MYKNAHPFIVVAKVPVAEYFSQVATRLRKTAVQRVYSKMSFFSFRRNESLGRNVFSIPFRHSVGMPPYFSTERRIPTEC
jgi:hypothetical protein